MRKVKRDQRKLAENFVSLGDIAKTSSNTYDLIQDVHSTQEGLSLRITAIEASAQRHFARDRRAVRDDAIAEAKRGERKRSESIARHRRSKTSRSCHAIVTHLGAPVAKDEFSMVAYRLRIHG
ncbi:hypothetical protein OSTOST_22106 [Ostertagia ostertagi]